MAMARFAPDFQAAIAPFLEASAAKPPPQHANVLELRSFIHELVAAGNATATLPAGILRTRYDVPVPGATPARRVAVYRYATANQAAALDGQPAVVYFHGGGMISGTVDLLSTTIAQQTADTGVQHFAVDYALAPEAGAAAILEECYAGLLFVHDQAAEFGIDPARIAVAGASAGGGLAASIALMARDRALAPPLAKMVLIYPMLDDRTVQAHPPRGARHPGANPHDDDWAVRPFLFWNCEQNALAWAAYLGVGRPGVDGPLEAAAALARADATATPAASPYAAAARAASLAGLPSTYIDCGGLDLFLEETTVFAARLAHDNVEHDLHIFHGVPHGFEMAPTSNAGQAAALLRNQAFNSF